MSPAAGPRRSIILVINPGSTTTKLALFKGPLMIGEKNLTHTAGETGRFTDAAAQEPFRSKLIEQYLKDESVDLQRLAAVVGRGGLLRPLAGGTYRVNARMKKDLRSARYGNHASNLGALLAESVARRAKCPAFIVDPVVVDELEEPARMTGVPEISRRSVFHALSQKAAARRACRELGIALSRSALVVAHLGGGISVGAHLRGRVIEVNNALDGEGPMAVERAGSLPAGDLVRMSFDGKYSQTELLQMITGRGGVVAHLGTNDFRRVERKLRNGHRKTARVVAAMSYSISRSIAACLAALRRPPHAIVLAGGVCRCRPLVREIRKRIGFIAPLIVYPENFEMNALAEGALRVLQGREQALRY